MVPPTAGVAPTNPFGADLMTGPTFGPPAAPRVALEPTTALQWLWGVAPGVLRTPLNTPLSSSAPVAPPAGSPAPADTSSGGCCGG
jgi:hypothetical protein